MNDIDTVKVIMYVKRVEEDYNNIHLIFELFEICSGYLNIVVIPAYIRVGTLLNWLGTYVWKYLLHEKTVVLWSDFYQLNLLVTIGYRVLYGS